MPRTKLSAHMDAQKDFARLLKAQSYAVYGSANKAAPHAGMKQPTLSRRLRDVDSFTIAEICGLRKALNIPKETLLETLEGLI